MKYQLYSESSITCVQIKLKEKLLGSRMLKSTNKSYIILRLEGNLYLKQWNPNPPWTGLKVTQSGEIESNKCEGVG